MDKNKKFTRITLAAVIIAVIGLTVAFAALSKTLTINGAGSLDRANWDIHFKNVQFLSKTPTATTTGTPTPTNNDKGPTIDNINVTLKQPGDYVSYTADIENEGDVDAAIYLVTLPTLTARQNQLFEFTAEYTQTQANGTKTIAQGDYLASGAVKNITITFRYKDITDASLLPSQPEQINLSYSIQYVQTELASGSSSQGSGQQSTYGEEVISWDITPTIKMYYYGGTESNGKYTGGTAVIRGTGAIPNYEDISDPVAYLLGAESVEDLMENADQYVDDSGLVFTYRPSALVIDSGITSIGDYAFAYVDSFQSLQLPSGITSIGESAFVCGGEMSDPGQIASVTFPSTLTTIGPDAFAGQINLTTINFNEGLTTIGYEAFYYTGITSLNLPSTVTSIGNSAFNHTQIETLRIPQSVTSIGYSAFKDCSNLDEIYIASEQITYGDGSGGDKVFANVANDVVVYCRTQAIADVINTRNATQNNKLFYGSGYPPTVVVDASKFN